MVALQLNERLDWSALCKRFGNNLDLFFISHCCNVYVSYRLPWNTHVINRQTSKCYKLCQCVKIWPHVLPWHSSVRTSLLSQSLEQRRTVSDDTLTQNKRTSTVGYCNSLCWVKDRSREGQGGQQRDRCETGTASNRQACLTRGTKSLWFSCHRWALPAGHRRNPLRPHWPRAPRWLNNSPHLDRKHTHTLASCHKKNDQ